MNLTFSYNWLKEYVDYHGKPEELARLLSLSGVNVEKMDDLSRRWENIVVAKIEKISRHPGADKLSLVDLNLGTEKRRVVCGGTNLREGMLVAYAKPGATIVDHKGTSIVLEEVKIRGEKSPGMICASEEIGLSLMFPPKNRDIVDLSGIAVAPSAIKTKLGTPLAEVLTKNDVLFEVEITTNRPDAMAIIGIAREAAAVSKSSLKEKVLKKFTNKDVLPLEVVVRNPELCPRFQVIILDDITVAPSPWWMQWRLVAAGIRPINNLVDITNYVMLEYGQPLHVFDYDTLKGKKIEVRLARKGEQYLALNGKTYTFTPDMLIGLDAERPVDLLCVMGGELTGATPQTKRIVLQAANIDPVSVRRTSRLLGLRSEAVERFEKGLPPEATGPALDRAVQLVQELAGGQVRGSYIDVWKGVKTKSQTIVLDPNYTNQVVGVTVPVATQFGILQRLGFSVQRSGKKFKVTVPDFRARDVEFDYDLVEEVVRVYGYTNVPSRIPVGGLTGHPPSRELQMERLAKQFFKGAGFTEVYPYSLTSEKMLNLFGINSTTTLKVSNPLNEDYTCLRPSLLPSLTQIVAENQEEFASGAIFEIAKQYHPWRDNSFEEKRLAAALWDEGSGEQAFYSLKGALEALGKQLHINFKYEPSHEVYYHPGRQGRIMVGKEILGTFGELHPTISERFGLTRRLSLGDLSFATLVKGAELIPHYIPPPIFPPVKRDLALVVDQKVLYSELVAAMNLVDPLLKQIELFDVYRGGQVGAGKKSLAFHLNFWHESRTLTAEEIEHVVGRLTATLAQKFSAVIRS